jgi:hypothetical protein
MTKQFNNGKKYGLLREPSGKDSFEKAALSKLKNGEKLGGKDGVMAPLIKHLLETALGGELEEHLAVEKAKNKKNLQVNWRQVEKMGRARKA